MRAEPQNSRLTIGLLTDQGINIFNYTLGLGVAELAEEQDADLILFPGAPLRSPHRTHAQVNVTYDLISPESVDGLVILGGALAHFVGAEQVKEFCERYHPLPMVSVMLELEGIPSVVTDSYQGIHDAMAHLIEAHGYRRIAFIRGPEGHPEAEDRYRAYIDALAEYEIPFDPNLVAPGEFAQPASTRAGKAAIPLLLDERGVDPEVIVAANDDMALGALEALQARGLRVPGDMAVVGFDDGREAKGATPPLTTSRQPMYKVGRQAAEMVLAQLRGEEVPERVTLPTELQVRQSCGCLPPQVIQAVAKETATDEPLEQALGARREQIMAEMAQEVEAVGIAPGWEEQILDTFIGELKGGSDSEGVFVLALDDLLRQAAAANNDLTSWQWIVSTLRRHLLPHLADEETRTRAENLWQQARVFIGETADRARTAQQIRSEQQAQTLREVGEALLTTFDVVELMDAVAEELPRLDIPSCYLALYDQQSEPARGTAPENARLILAYDENSRRPLESRGRPYLSRQLVPKDVLPRHRQYTMTTQPLFFREEQIGFALFEAGPGDAATCKAVQGELSSALQGALLVQQVEDRAVQLQTAAEVSRAASSILDPSELIQQTVELARERFDLYYAGLFLVDQTGQWTDEPGRWAVLRAGTGEAGQKMLARGHKLEIGGSSMIGWCVANKQARIALDVGEEAVRFDNPLLPETHSELALPLIARGEAIGALTIQSSQESAFSEEDISVLQTMADQVANAIANAQLYNQAQQELAERQRMEETLQEANYALQRRAVHLEASAEVGRAITSIFEVDQLLRRTVELISDRFGFYHAGIFLMDQTGEWAVLQEATGKAGAQMKADGHRLAVDETSMVGWTALHRQPRIALDVGEDAVRFSNPLLPHTRSEMTLPLVVGDRLIGVLNVQSTEESAFDEDDIRALQNMADQVAVAIENARRLSDEALLLEATSPVYRASRQLTTATTIDEVAQAIIASVAETGADGCTVVEFGFSTDGAPQSLLYRGVWRRDRKPSFQPGTRLPISESPFPYKMVSTLATIADVEHDERLPDSARRVFKETGVRALVNIPLHARERVIGQVVVLHTRPTTFSDTALRLYEALSDQAAVALERAQLLEETQRRAEQERQARRLLDQIRQAADVERAMQVAARELSQMMEVPRVSIELSLEGADGQETGT